MPTKKKKITKTAAKRTVAARTHKRTASRTCCKKCSKGISNAERTHVYIVTALSFAAVILLCADAAIMMVS